MARPSGIRLLSGYTRIGRVIWMLSLRVTGGGGKVELLTVTLQLKFNDVIWGFPFKRSVSVMITVCKK
jgi:hypothetical protein